VVPPWSVQVDVGSDDDPSNDGKSGKRSTTASTCTTWTWAPSGRSRTVQAPGGPTASPQRAAGRRTDTIPSSWLGNG